MRTGRAHFPVLCLLAFLAGILPASAQQSASPELERRFQQAMAAQDRGDLDQAQRLLFTLHREHPGNFAVDESLGLLLVSRGDISSALPLLQAAVREKPSSDVAHANLGAAWYQLHRAQAALEEFEQAVRLNSGNFSAQVSLGRICMESHRPDRAATALLAALHLQSSTPGEHPDPDLQLDAATALIAANRTAEAEKLLGAFPDADRSARAQALLGELSEKQGRFQAAAQHLANAAALDPSEENAWQLGVEFLRHWTFPAAVTEFRAACARFPDSIRLRLGLGAALFGDAQYAQAIPVFADLLHADPRNAGYAQMLGIACNAHLESIDPRCSALTGYAQAHPADAEANTLAASLLITQKKDESLARTFLEHALAASPRSPEAQYQMGLVLQDQQNWTASIPYLERAVKLKPDFARAHYRLALAYVRVGRKQEAQVQMQLQQKLSHEGEQDLDRRLRQITRFVVEVR